MPSESTNGVSDAGGSYWWVIAASVLSETIECYLTLTLRAASRFFCDG